MAKSFLSEEEAIKEVNNIRSVPNGCKTVIVQCSCGHYEIRLVPLRIDEDVIKQAFSERLCGKCRLLKEKED